MTAPRAKDRPITARIGVPAVFVVATICAGLLFAQPRKVTPSELPALTLPADAVRAQILADANAAAHAPHGPRVIALEDLMTKQGQTEARGTEDASSYENRRRALELEYTTSAKELGDAAMLQLRAKAVLALEDAIALKLSLAQAKAVLGAMPRVLEREGASRDGELVAPMFVVRTLYKARWNILCGLAPDRAFAPIELRAYYGWQALHGERVPLRKRVEALHAYATAGGEHSEEALGVLLYRIGDYAQSAKALQTAYDLHPSLRLRNYALAAREAAGLEN